MFIRRPGAGSSNVTKSAAKQASKRLASAKRKPTRATAYGNGVGLSEEVLRTLDSLYASVEERAVFNEVLADCRFPFVNQALVQGIISGIRKGQRMNQYVDAALDSSIEEELQKSEGVGEGEHWALGNDEPPNHNDVEEGDDDAR